MKVLVLGASGMLGHKLMQVLSRRFLVLGTVRGSALIYRDHPVLGEFSLLGDVNADDFESVDRVLRSVGPDVVVNCIGIIKQMESAKEPLISIAINSLFPNKLAKLCRSRNIRMIHISTDCVFSGRKGNYSEDDIPDAEDLYGRTKLLGEVGCPECLTIRTSIIGRELKGNLGLAEWFISQRGGTVNGYAHAIYTGFTTLALSEIIGDLIQDHPKLCGIWQISSDPISKNDLLSILNREYDLNITIKKDGIFFCDRSLNSTRFREMAGFKPPTWDEMIAQMANDPTPYSEVRVMKLWK
jgi:dTDP-4-dehydrorhamnose reductase